MRRVAMKENRFSTEFNGVPSDNLPVELDVRVLRLPPPFWAEHCDWTQGLNRKFLGLAAEEKLFRTIYKGKIYFERDVINEDHRKLAAESYFEASNLDDLEAMNNLTMRASDVVCFSPSPWDYGWADREDNGGKTQEEWEEYFEIFELNEEEKAQRLEDRANWSGSMALPVGWATLNMFSWSSIRAIDEMSLEDMDSYEWLKPKCIKAYKNIQEQINRLSVENDFKISADKIVKIQREIDRHDESLRAFRKEKKEIHNALDILMTDPEIKETIVQKFGEGWRWEYYSYSGYLYLITPNHFKYEGFSKIEIMNWMNKHENLSLKEILLRKIHLLSQRKHKEKMIEEGIL